MKKLLSITIMLLVAIVASAQGEWVIQQSEGDELKGTPASTTYNYVQEGMGAFVFWGYDVPHYALFSPNAPFNTKVSGEYIGMIVLVGIYDDDDHLLEKFTMWLDKDTGRSGLLRTRVGKKMFTPVGQEKNMKKIFAAFKSGKGYVRIVAERYNHPDFDIKIHPYKEQNAQ